MNNTFENYFDKAELALAAYSDFSEIPLNKDGFLNTDVIKSRLTSTFVDGKENEKSPDSSKTEADEFVKRFDVIDQFTETSFGNGFSATVFQDKNTKELFFVNRGTDGGGDYVVV